MIIPIVRTRIERIRRNRVDIFYKNLLYINWSFFMTICLKVYETSASARSKDEANKFSESVIRKGIGFKV